MKKLQIAYFGTPYFSAHFLEKLIKDTLLEDSLPVEVKFVVTQPDKPVGRKQIITSTPVKQVALENKIPVIEDLETFYASRLTLNDLDFAFLYAYSGIIPKEILHVPRFGFLNTHPSLLPKYRGPSPIAYPLIFGDDQTGVTLIKLDEEIDHGPVLAQEKLEIKADDRRPDLEIKLTDLAYEMFKRLINEFALSVHTERNQSEVEGLKLKEQDHKKAIFTRKLTKQDGYISLPVLQKTLKNEQFQTNKIPHLIENWKSKIKNSAKIIYDYFRGLYPWPGLWTLVTIKGQEKRLKITDV